jgi:hypothetical protein
MVLWCSLALCLTLQPAHCHDGLHTNAGATEPSEYSGMRRSRKENRDLNQDDQSRELQMGSDTVVNFNLYNSETDVKITSLTNGAVINLNPLNISPMVLNIEAVVLGSTKPGSVKLSLDITLYNRIEGGAPYSLCGNVGTNFKPCQLLTLGTHSVQAIPYTGKNATGEILGSNYAVSFMIINSISSPAISLPAPTPIIPPPATILTKAPTKRPVVPPVPAPSPENCSIPKVREEEKALKCCKYRVKFFCLTRFVSLCVQLVYWILD